MEISSRQLDRHRLVKRMFTLRQVQMFETVARLGSYSKAAVELGVSQPAVSVQVQELEKELGTDLFERAGRRSRLTEIGTAFYPRAARILAAVEESLVEVDSFLGLERGRVRAGAIESMGLYLLPSSMREFGESHPGIDLELTIETPDEIAAGLRSGRMDIGFGDRSLADEASIESIELRVVEFVVITSREHPLALQQKVPAAKLAGETFIVEGDASPSMWGLEWLASRVDGDGPNVGMQVTSCDALKRMVRANLGIAVTYDFCVEWEYSARSNPHVEYSRVILGGASICLSHARARACAGGGRISQAGHGLDRGGKRSQALTGPSNRHSKGRQQWKLWRPLC